MESRLVSVILPTYNTGKPLRTCLEGILRQTYKDLEIVITDDCSTDEITLSILREFEEKDSRVRVYRLKENGGAGWARNNSIKHAKGRFIAFCDSDDTWVADKLERQVEFMLEGGHCLVCSSYYVCDEDGEITGIVKCPPLISYSMLKRDNKIGCLTAIYDTQKHGKFYMPLIRKRQDWAMFLEIVSKCGNAYALTEPLAYYRISNHSLSRSKTSLVKYNVRVYREVLGFNKIKAALYFFFLFLPSYFAKVVKVRIDSKRIRKERRRGNNQEK